MLRIIVRIRILNIDTNNNMPSGLLLKCRYPALIKRAGNKNHHIALSFMSWYIIINKQIIINSLTRININPG